LIKKIGRVSKTDLVRECNKLIKLKAEPEDTKKQQQEVADLAKELEREIGQGIPEEKRIAS
jgi:hypothetical protein